jgi:hypothetical protein
VVSELLSLMLADKLLSIYGNFIITPLVSHWIIVFYFGCILAASSLHIFGVFLQLFHQQMGILRMFM